MTQRKRFVRLGDDDQERLRDALHGRGEDAVAEHLDISRLSVMRAACGLGVLRGTRTAIAAGLASLDNEDEDEDEDDLDESDDDDDSDEDDDDDDEPDDDDVGTDEDEDDGER